jgi:YcaO-like protein with predicted kinase domain
MNNTYKEAAPKMLRPYKEATPKQTVFKIRNILEKVDILVTPTLIKSPFKNIYSTRIEASEQDGSFGANGKGKTPIFSLASAYAEIIERIQNSLMLGGNGVPKSLNNYIKKRTDFHYYPDERIMSKDEFLSLDKKLFSDFFLNTSQESINKTIQTIYDRLFSENKKGLVSVPFFNINNKEVMYIPYNFLLAMTGTNGMAAGNTIAEATFQAIAEIFERYTVSQVYNNNLTPPTIPDNYIKFFPEEYSILKRIEGFGYKVIVKDFSLGLNLPVVGLILLDEVNNKYLLNVGSDTSFQVALSRTITEIYQGLDSNTIKNKLLEKPSMELTPYFFNGKNDKAKKMNLIQYMRNGTGYFPPSLFENEFSYHFDSSVFKTRKSYEEEVKYMFSIAKKLNFSIYARDVSFLGFPTVYIYMPEISVLGNKNYSSKFDEPELVSNDLEDLIYPFEDLITDKNKIKKVLSILEKTGLTQLSTDDLNVSDLFRLEFKIKSNYGDMKMVFLLVLLSFLAEDFKNAINFLRRYIKLYNLINDEYYKSVLEYFTLLEAHKPIKNIPDEILESFNSPSNLFRNIGYPKCPNCSECSIKKDCLTRINIENAIKINNITKDVAINQYQFEIFS